MIDDTGVVAVTEGTGSASRCRRRWGDQGFVPAPRGIGRARSSPVISIVFAVTALVLAACGGGGGAPLGANGGGTTATSTSSPSAASTTTSSTQPREGHTPSTTGALPAMAWPVRPLAPTPHVRSVVATTTTLYWITGPRSATCHAGSTIPVRFDPIDGKSYRGAPFGACDAQQLVAGGGSVWALERTATALDLAALDPRTLAVTKTETFPGTSAATLAVGPGTALWLTNGGEIWRLDAASGAVEGHFTPTSTAAVLSPSPTGKILYTSGKNPTGGGAVVDEYAASSGALLARATFSWCVAAGPTALAAGPGRVWTSCRGGNAGDVTALTSNGLKKVTRPRTPTTPFGPFSHIGDVGISAGGGALWIDTEGELFCADPATGSIRAGASDPVDAGFGAFAVNGIHVYSTASWPTPRSQTPESRSVAVSVAAPRACFGG